MDSQEFIRFRKKLDKTQEEIARLLGVSVKAIRSYEQGWRSVPSHVERLIMFLSSRKEEILDPQQPCWVTKNCKETNKENCPAWEFQVGNLCWFLYGTPCNRGAASDWKEKINLCKNCSAFPPCLKEHLKSTSNDAPDESCFTQQE